MLTHAGLFSGIGGFSLAAEWMGWQNVFEVELDPFCRQVLHKNFPHSQLFEDVCLFDGLPFRGRIDVLSGGFPCQPFSSAGKRLGTADPRALWPQMLRVIRECQPRFVVGENVRGLLSNGGGLAFDAVCADLEAEGYEVQPLLLPAVGVGAPHKRDRFWFVAHANDGRGQRQPQQALCTGWDAADTGGEALGNAHGSYCERLQSGASPPGRAGAPSASCPTPHPSCGHGPAVGHLLGRQSDASGCSASHPAGQRRQAQHARAFGNQQGRDASDAAPHPWRLTEPPLCSPNDGVSARLVRTASPRAKQLKAYGNAIVPQVAYQIFQAIEATLLTPY